MSEPLVVCINHPEDFDTAALHRRLADCGRPIELLPIPYKENLKLRLARRTPPVPADLEALAPSLTPQLIDAYARCEVLMALDLPETLLELTPRLRWVQAFSAGTEHLPVAALEQAGIALTTASGAGAVPIAEFVIGRLLEVWKDTRSIEQMQRQRNFTRPRSRLLAGSTLGIVGLGAIGKAVAERARALGMRVIANRRRFNPGDPSPLVDKLLGPDAIDELVAGSDAVVLAAPDTPATRNLMNERRLSLMKPDSVLCNVARGNLVDEIALARALERGKLGAAILDVTRQEPLPTDHPLWSAPHVYLSPHCAISPDTYDHQALELLAENLQRYAAAEPLRNLVQLQDDS